jgi:DNA-binding transcriptional MerR regulator
MSQSYLHRDVVKIFPWLKARTLISWSERGLIVPEITDAAGRGSSRMYSYSNLIQIGMLAELLRFGIPFTQIREMMESDEMKNMLSTRNFDAVYWLSRELVSAKVPMDKEAPWLGRFGFMTFDDFLKKGAGNLVDVSIKDSERREGNVTSAFLLNVRSIKRFVDKQLTRVTK